MLRNAKTLLDLCTERFPSPRPDQRHNLVVRDGVLNLTLMQGDTYVSFDLSEVDLERTPESLVEELTSLVAQATEERLAKQKAGDGLPDETA